MGRLGRQLGPEAVAKLNDRVVAIARENRVATGRKMPVDTTVVETNIHYPTDSRLLGDGVRVLTRVMKKVSAVAGTGGTNLRARAGDCAGQPQQDREGPAETETGLWETAGNRQSGGGPSQAVLAGDRAEGQARRPRDIAQSQKATGRNDSTRAAGHAPGTPARHERQHACAGKASQRL